MNPPASETMGAKVWDILLKAMVPLSVVLAGTIVAHEVRISVIESNRFTKDDAFKMQTSILAETSPWLRDSVNEIKLTVKEIDTRLRNVEKLVK